MNYSIKVEWTNKGYILLQDVYVWSERYQKRIVALEGDEFDGATSAIDVCPDAWIPHDVLCRDGVFFDGTPCSNLMASFVIYDQLIKNGRWFRARTWFLATLAVGGGKARKNGIFKVR